MRNVALLRGLLGRAAAATAALHGVAALGCGELEPPAPTSVAWVSAHYPAAAPLLRRAAEAPAMAAGSGFALGAPERRSAGFLSAARPLAASLPRLASEALRLGDGSAEVVVRRRGALPAAGALDEGAVVYREALPGVDALVFSDGHAVEELLVVRDGRAQIGYDIELPAGWMLAPARGASDVVEVRDERGAPRLRATAATAWDAAGHGVPLELGIDGRGLALRVGDAAAYPILVDPSWLPAGAPQKLRKRHTATLLPGGRVLLAGGLVGDSSDDSAEICDSRSGECARTNGSMRARRHGHTATNLPGGRVLLAGGFYNAGGSFSEAQLASAEIFDPITEQFEDAGSLGVPRGDHTATPLPGGRVLFVGGGSETAEIYDADAQTFTAAGRMAFARRGHAAALLPDGRVFVVGGTGNARVAAEVFDPSANGGAGGFTPTAAPLSFDASGATATLLRDGKVLVTGGCDCELDSCFCPATGIPGSGRSSAAAELFDPVAGAFAPTGSLSVGRLEHSATLLPSGEVLIAGGTLDGEIDRATAEIYEPIAGRFLAAEPMSAARGAHTATLLPSGAVLLAGGQQASSDLFVARGLEGPGAFTRAALMAVERYLHASTPLRDGRILIAGGKSDTRYAEASAEIFDPARSALLETAPMIEARYAHSLTLLLDGRVLVVGGSSDDAGGTGPRSSAELFDPAADEGRGRFVTATGLGTARYRHAAVRLPSGKVLVAGGIGADGTRLATAEVFDPETGAWTSGLAMKHAHGRPGAALLTTGEVLIVSGATAEIYDPVAGTFTETGPPGTSYLTPTVTVLPTGKALVLGGETRAAELYDPITRTFAFSSPAAVARQNHTATPLPTGDILVAGGDDGSRVITEAELFNPLAEAGRGAFYPAAAMQNPSSSAISAAPLPSGQVLVTGGLECIVECIATASNRTELWTTRGEDRAWRPALSSAPARVSPGSRVPIQGARLGGPEASGGRANASVTAIPIALWQPASGSGYAPSLITDWTETSATWLVPATALRGPGWLRVVVNGIASAALPVTIDAAELGVPCSFGAECTSGFCADGVCCDAACDGPCDGCTAARKGSGADGACGTVPAGAAADDACALDLGAGCASDLECASGRCVDGFCCDAPCTAQCEACDVAGSEGRCVPVAGRPHGERTACAPEPPGDPCEALICGGVERATCTAKVGPCVPFACGGDGCVTACEDDAGCAAGYHCEAGACLAGQCDGALATTPDGTLIDCSPYRCEADGSCRTSCAKVSDCVAPFACNAAGRCAARPDSDAAGGCTLGAAGAGGRARALALLAALALVWRARRRAERGAA